jgi:excisionase family DNA binding protein
VCTTRKTQNYMNDSNIGEWLTVKAACQILGVSDANIRRLVRGGDLKAAQLRAKGKAWGRLLISKQSLISLLERGAVHASAN